MPRRFPLALSFSLLPLTLACQERAPTPANETAGNVAAQAAPARQFYEGHWAADARQCKSAAWTIDARALQAPDGSSCRFEDISGTGPVSVRAQCIIAGRESAQTLSITYAESAGALLFEGAPFGHVALVSCDGDDTARARAAAAVAPSPDALPLQEHTEDGARRVLEAYIALMKAQRYDDASRLLATGENLQRQQTRAIAEATRHPDAQIDFTGPPRSEGAAGSIYLTIPFTLSYANENGRAVRRTGTATLRRVNDVPGTTEAQRSWRIQNAVLNEH